MRYEYANPYDPLAWKYLTHEDKCYLVAQFGLIWVSGTPGASVSLMPISGRPWAGNVYKRIEQVNEAAEKGDRYALKIMREITKAKLLGRLEVKE